MLALQSPASSVFVVNASYISGIVKYLVLVQQDAGSAYLHNNVQLSVLTSNLDSEVLVDSEVLDTMLVRYCKLLAASELILFLAKKRKPYKQQFRLISKKQDRFEQTDGTNVT